MMRWCSVAVVLLCAQTARAQSAPASAEAELCPVPIGQETGGGFFSRFQGPFLRDTAVGSRPHVASTMDPAHGYPHYDLPSKHYGMWYRPAAFAEDTQNKCASRVFAPRGYGWGNRLDCTQMDYNPYVVKQLPSRHGPSYYHRPPLEPCHCALQGCGHKGALVR
jgi:hypothetical protein